VIRFLEIAEIELDQAIRWYAAQAPGLDNAFLIEVLSVADRIARFSESMAENACWDFKLLLIGVPRARCSTKCTADAGFRFAGRNRVPVLQRTVSRCAAPGTRH
jgi:hypothetical protein